MKIALVNPPRVGGLPVIREERCEITERYSVLPPYSLLQIGSLLRRDGHEVRLIDANGRNLSYEELHRALSQGRYDVLIFRFTPTTFDADMKTASVSKSIDPQATTAAMCWTLRTVPQEVLRDAPDLDVYLRHEYEVVAPALVRCLDRGESLGSVKGIAYRVDGRIATSEEANPIFDYDSIPVAAWELLPDLGPYFINNPHGRPFAIMYASKGCPFQCTFCTVANTKWKKRSAESIVEELRYLKQKHHVRTISFFDETFTIDRRRIQNLCEMLRTENLAIRWYCNTRVDLVNPEILREMYAAGCRGMSFGVESGDQRILDGVKKEFKVSEARNAITWAKQAGIKVYCSFIIGLPGETHQTIDTTIDFVNEVLPNGAQFNVAVPYPGTPLHDELLSQGKIEVLDWRQYYQHSAAITGDGLAPEELEAARRRAYRSLYANPRWILQNVAHVLRHPEDVEVATSYTRKIVNNYVFKEMKHSH
jgi:radical SAM superfamily enzyme YgiQ (UPF0313 family)